MNEINNTIPTSRKRPFANGSQHLDWISSNCERCKKHGDDEAGTSKCGIEQALFDAAMDDGSIWIGFYKRMGAGTGRYNWPCPEVDWTEAWKQEYTAMKELEEVKE